MISPSSLIRLYFPSVAKSTGSLILATVVSCLTMALCTGNSYLSILIPGEMFQDAYRERGLAAKNLSRTLEMPKPV